MKLLTAVLAILPLLGAQEPAKETPPAKQEPAAEAPKSEPAAAPAAAETTERNVSGTLDIGYRVRTDIAGNQDAWRRAVNLGEGPKLFNADIRVVSPTKKLFDNLTLFTNNWGGEPYSSTRLNVFKEKTYEVRLNYLNNAYVNFLPTFANPLLETGVLRTERGYDLRRRMFDAEVRLFPGARITPYVSVARNAGDGRGVTTFVESINEYPVSTSLNDTTSILRGGAVFEFSRGHFTFEQGDTWYSEDTTNNFAGRSLGNRTTPFSGQELRLTNLNEQYRIRGGGPFTRVIGAVSPASWIDVSGHWIFSQPNTEVNYNLDAAGNFVDLSTLQFFSAQRTVGASAANQPHTSGGVTVELRPGSRFRILESYSTDRLRVRSNATLTESNAAGTPQLPGRAFDNFRNDYSRHQLEGLVDVTRWLTLRAGFRNVWGDVIFRSPQVNDTIRDIGDMRTNVLLAGAQLRLAQRLRVNLDAEHGASSRTYFRTSLHDYDKGTARIRYQAFTSLALTANLTALYNENPTPGVNYEFKSRQGSLGFLWNPANAKRYSMIGDYTFSAISSNIGYFVPQFLTPELSQYRDNAHAGTLLFDVSPGGKYAPHVSLGGSVFKSSGSRPTTYSQPMARVSLPVHERANIFSEWRYYGMGEQYYSFEGFRSHTFMIGLRLLR